MYPLKITPENRDSMYGLKIIHEGIADYFARLVYFNDLEKVAYYTEYYSEWSNLVAPVIGQYGVEGILAMTRNPPQGQKVYHLLQWRGEVLETLAQE